MITKLRIMEMETSPLYSTILYTICMYCGKLIDTKNGGGISGTSHGMCTTCKEEHHGIK